MKKLLPLPVFLILCFFGFLRCQKSPSLKDFCGEFAQHAHMNYSHKYLLSFKSKKGAGLIDVEVSKSEYEIYKNGLRPIDCK